jgi:hypothetical protein
MDFSFDLCWLILTFYRTVASRDQFLRLALVNKQWHGVVMQHYWRNEFRISTLLHKRDETRAILQRFSNATNAYNSVIPHPHMINRIYLEFYLDASEQLSEITSYFTLLCTLLDHLKHVRVLYVEVDESAEMIGSFASRLLNQLLRKLPNLKHVGFARVATVGDDHQHCAFQSIVSVLEPLGLQTFDVKQVVSATCWRHFVPFLLADTLTSLALSYVFDDADACILTKVPVDTCKRLTRLEIFGDSPNVDPRDTTAMRNQFYDSFSKLVPWCAMLEHVELSWDSNVRGRVRYDFYKVMALLQTLPNLRNLRLELYDSATEGVVELSFPRLQLLTLLRPFVNSPIVQHLSSLSWPSLRLLNLHGFIEDKSMLRAFMNNCPILQTLLFAVNVPDFIQLVELLDVEGGRAISYLEVFLVLSEQATKAYSELVARLAASFPNALVHVNTGTTCTFLYGTRISATPNIIECKLHGRQAAEWVNWYV